MRPEAFWQEILPEDAAPAPPWRAGYPARLPDGRVLMLPIRPLAGTETALASLILNQAAFAVEDALADALAERLAGYRPDVVVGLPTLGLSLARAVALRLGHTRYVPLGTSRKFWYEDRLSVPVSSITSPGAEKRLYLDPRMLPLLEGRRIALVDDVISTGTSIRAGLELKRLAGLAPVVVGAAMLQTDRWRAALEGHPVEGVLRTPLLHREDDGWSDGVSPGRAV